MSDIYENNNNIFNENTTPQNDNPNTTDGYSQSTAPQDDNTIYSSSQQSETPNASNTESANEGSYEWNADNGINEPTGGEYHYSYINGNNENASHNPNNYDNAYPANQQNVYNDNYSQATNSQTTDSTYASDQSTANQQNTYGGYAQQNAYGGYAQQPYQNPQYGTAAPHMKAQKVKKPKVKKPKKPSKPVSRRFLAAAIAITILSSAALGIGGGYLGNKLGSSSSGSVNINQVSASNTSSNSESSAGLTSNIVKQTADSVVEIVTESVSTGSFAQQYVQTGAGSGVIISDDGYIITNHHVIDGANSVKVTLRDGTTSYDATIVGSDEDNDIALLKIDATGLSPATFGDSSSLAVGDYVVAIGNPLGELGGTVTDGIISALARQVTIENKNMTLLQTNAQINPGNSGGGLFNSKGELVGVVNAKDTATEVEGIGFAIPINNVLDIINDLKSYGYVTGKVQLGFESTDITSKESAFYYGVNQTGCYVLSVTQGSNAEKAGLKSGDLVTAINGTTVSSTADIKTAITDSKVGDTIKISVYRNGKSTDIEYALEEYVPSNSSSSGQSATTSADSNGSSGSDNSIWSRMFG